MILNLQSLLSRIQILFQQGRWEDARQLLETYLDDNPQDRVARLMYAQSLVNTGETKTARTLVGGLLEEEPDNESVLQMACILELNDDKPAVAERYARTLIDLDARNSTAFELLAQVKLRQNNYDKAQQYARVALELDPANQAAANLNIYVTDLLATGNTDELLDDALARNPEDPDTIANHARTLLRAGKVDEALKRLKYALAINPRNQLARYVMLEALKARFLPYRAYMWYNESMAKLSGGASMGIIIGLWFGANWLGRLSGSNPEYAWIIDPVYYLLIGLFLMTWLITPLMNFYLLTNPYGRLLLDEDDKKMARLVGGSLGAAVISFLAYFFISDYRLLISGFIFVGLCIPLGSFLRSGRPKTRMYLTLATVAIAVLAFAGLLLDQPTLLNGAGLGLLGYQFLLNSMVARDQGRTFGE